jgi:AcrR family transcriptional regulator
LTAANANSTKNVRRRQPEQVRERILAAALSVFAARGFDGATMQLIATQSGASLPLIVYHFKSKEKLWQAVIENTVAHFDALIEKATQKNNGHTATEQLKDVIEAIVRVSVALPEFRRILETESYTMTPRLQWIGDNFARRHHKIITGLIKKAQDERQVVNVEPHRLSYMITGMATNSSNGAEYQYLTGLDPSSNEEVEGCIQAINKLVFIAD